LTICRRKEEEKEEEEYVAMFFLERLTRAHCNRTSTGKKKKVVQTAPPRVAVSKLFKNGVYPVGEEQEYKNE
jgi:hypothetical protein